MSRERDNLCVVYGDELLFMDGFDHCILGVIRAFGKEPVVAYSMQEVLGTLEGQGMTPEEAEEFFEFNQLGAYVGEHTPVFIDMRDWSA